MALNFTVSYSFSPATTISSSQVNTNTSDVAAVFQGLEAETKTLAKLKVDIDPTTALEVATKQYVDHYSTYRRPTLVNGSVTTVAVESGMDGTSGNIPILFPDGTIRTETSATRTTFNITRNAVLVTSGAQSGLTGATSEATNTWYALYAVKVTDSSTLWVTVGSTVLPLQASYAALNTAYGTSGWVYLGLIRNGDNSGATGDILQFVQTGNTTLFLNQCLCNATINTPGTLLATTAGATSLVYTYAAGTGAAQIPANIGHSYFTGNSSGTGTGALIYKGTTIDTTHMVVSETANRNAATLLLTAQQGFTISAVASVARSITLSGFIDNVLGVGSNPLL